MNTTTTTTFPMIEFYGESSQNMESSVAHSMDVLNRIFRQLEPYGVKMLEESIPGLNGATLQRWFNAYRKDRKPSTVNNAVCILNPFLRWAHTIYPDAIGDYSNVLHTVRLPQYDKMPEEDRPKEHYYTDAQIRKLLEIPKHDTDLKKRDRAIIAMFLATGLRVSELCQLKIGNLTDHGHGYVYVRRKGGAYKTTEVAEFAYEHIERYLRTRKDRSNADAPLFLTIHGEPVNRYQLYHSMRNRLKKVVDTDVYGVKQHNFRHTFVSAVEKAGGGAVARDLANHKSLAITNRYDHSTAEQRRAAVDSLRFGA